MTLRAGLVAMVRDEAKLGIECGLGGISHAWRRAALGRFARARGGSHRIALGQQFPAEAAEPDHRSMTVASSGPSVLCVGGEDHHLRIPFLLALRRCGLGVTAAGTGDPTPFERAGLPYHTFRFDRFLNPIADLASTGLIRRLLDIVRPDIVQSFDTKPNVLVPLAAGDRRDVRIIRTINGMGWVYSSRGPLALALRPVQRLLHRRAGRAADATVFQNTSDKAFFEHHGLVGHGRSTLIPGSGVDVERFDRELADVTAPDALRAELGLGSGQIVVTVTRLTRQKGIPTLLKAAALVHRTRPDVRFLLVGPRESEGSFAVTKKEIDRHAPYVIATGPRNDVGALLRLADVFAFPTEYREGVPRALLEAALASLPIVTTDMPGCTDVVTDRLSGLIVPPRSPGKLAAGIVELLHDRQMAREMGRRVSDRVRQEFGLALTVARYRDLYFSLLEHPPASVTAPDSDSRLQAAVVS